MISQIHLKFGAAQGVAPTPIDASHVTLFVGPNNSGKSLLLREVRGYCSAGQEHENTLVLRKLDFVGLDAEEARESIMRFAVKPAPGEHLSPNTLLCQNRGSRFQIQWPSILSIVQDPTKSHPTYCQSFLHHYTQLLDGPNRINLVQQQGAGDLQQPPSSSLQVLFRDDKKRSEVRRIVYEAIGSHFVIDPTQLGIFRIRLSDSPPSHPSEERGLDAPAVAFHGKAKLIDEMSDGVKAFTGILTDVIAGDPRVLLIDEPEAFLHPALASKLGYEVSRAVLSTDKRFLASTHSPAFVMGCIQSGTPVSIIRLTYRNGAATARSLPSAELLQLMRNPLLRSTGVLSSLFYEFVVVTESDADRAFYQEVNERLLRFKPEWGIPNCLFINAQNKQTVPTIVRPLRKLGIPAAGIVDIDVVKDGGQIWTNLLDSAGVPQVAQNPLGTMRNAIKQAMEATGLDMKRKGGVNILARSEKEAALGLLKQLADYGIFTVSTGELESWLPELGINGGLHGPSWLISMFERLGEDPENANYIRPGDTDVWHFMSTLRHWLVDPIRKGIPD